MASPEVVRILGRIIETKVLKSFPPCYSQSHLLTNFTHPPPHPIQSGLKLVCNINIVYETSSLRTLKIMFVHEFGFGIQNTSRETVSISILQRLSFLRQHINFQMDETYTTAGCKKYSDASKKQTFLLSNDLFASFIYKKTDISDTFKDNFKTNMRDR
jgi:hypothetical protein